MEKPNYYAIIPANVRYDTDLTPNAKLLYGEITALCNKDGCCWSTNEYFANLYNVSKVSISNWISLLTKKGYILNEVVYKEGSKEILNRYLKILEYPIKENFNTPIKENFKDNNTSNINSTSINKEINNNKLLFTKKKFQKPTLEEVQQYCLERKNNINAEKFIDYYESNGWKVGRNSMKDWKATIRTWEKNQEEKAEKFQTYQSKTIKEQNEARERFLRGEIQ